MAGKGLEDSYGTRVNKSEGVISCSYLGAAFYLSGSSIIRPDWTVISLMLLAFLVGIMV